MAFAILNPNYPVRLFFLIPIPVKFLAIVDGLYLIWRIIQESWPGRVAIAFSLLNLLLFFGGSLFRRIKNLRRQKEYRDSFSNGSDYWGQRSLAAIRRTCHELPTIFGLYPLPFPARLGTWAKPGIRLLARVGNRQNKGKFLHIAGTNGKGSLVQLSGNLLMQAGYKVGKYTSPYVLEFRERFTVNDEMISETDLAAWTTRLKPMVDKLEGEGVLITEFEFITVLAFCWFAQMGCDVVCLEVGLGGRFDATNVISHRWLV